MTDSRTSTSLPDAYYEDDWITIYHGDSRDFVDLIDADVLVTDPPYGVDLGTGSSAGGDHGLLRGSYDGYEDTYANLVADIIPILDQWIAKVRRGAVFSGPHLQEMPKAVAVGGVFCPAAKARHSWGFKTFLPVLFYGKDPTLNKGARPNTIRSTASSEKVDHPCPKPLSWMRWLVDRCALPGEVIVDPFMGSGTTLRAAKDAGIRAVGIELHEPYCEVAAERMSQGVLNFGGTANAV